MIKIKEHYKTNSPEAVAATMREVLLLNDKHNIMKEMFWAIGLDTQNVIQYIDLVSMGILTETLVHPREVFLMAITKQVRSIIICHNHPSGKAVPSSEDKIVTKRLVESSKILNIPIVDHVIISAKDNEYYSFQENGHI